MSAEAQSPHKPCSYCGEGMTCEHGYCYNCQECKECLAEAKQWAEEQ